MNLIKKKKLGIVGFFSLNIFATLFCVSIYASVQPFHQHPAYQLALKSAQQDLKHLRTEEKGLSNSGDPDSMFQISFVPVRNIKRKSLEILESMPGAFAQIKSILDLAGRRNSVFLPDFTKNISEKELRTKKYFIRLQVQHFSLLWKPGFPRNIVFVRESKNSTDTPRLSDTHINLLGISNLGGKLKAINWDAAVATKVQQFVIGTWNTNRERTSKKITFDSLKNLSNLGSIHQETRLFIFRVAIHKIIDAALENFRNKGYFAGFYPENYVFERVEFSEADLESLLSSSGKSQWLEEKFENISPVLVNWQDSFKDISFTLLFDHWFTLNNFPGTLPKFQGSATISKWMESILLTSEYCAGLGQGLLGDQFNSIFYEELKKAFLDFWDFDRHPDEFMNLQDYLTDAYKDAVHKAEFYGLLPFNLPSLVEENVEHAFQKAREKNNVSTIDLLNFHETHPVRGFMKAADKLVMFRPTYSGIVRYQLHQNGEISAEFWGFDLEDQQQHQNLLVSIFSQTNFSVNPDQKNKSLMEMAAQNKFGYILPTSARSPIAKALKYVTLFEEMDEEFKDALKNDVHMNQPNFAGDQNIPPEYWSEHLHTIPIFYVDIPEEASDASGNPIFGSIFATHTPKSVLEQIHIEKDNQKFVRFFIHPESLGLYEPLIEEFGISGHFVGVAFSSRRTLGVWNPFIKNPEPIFLKLSLNLSSMNFVRILTEGEIRHGANLANANHATKDALWEEFKVGFIDDFGGVFVKNIAAYIDEKFGTVYSHGYSVRDKSFIYTGNKQLKVYPGTAFVASSIKNKSIFDLIYNANGKNFKEALNSSPVRQILKLIDTFIKKTGLLPETHLQNMVFYYNEFYKRIEGIKFRDSGSVKVDSELRMVHGRPLGPFTTYNTISRYDMGQVESWYHEPVRWMLRFAFLKKASISEKNYPDFKESTVLKYLENLHRDFASEWYDSYEIEMQELQLLYQISDAQGFVEASRRMYLKKKWQEILENSEGDFLPRHPKWYSDPMLHNAIVKYIYKNLEDTQYIRLRSLPIESHSKLNLATYNGGSYFFFEGGLLVYPVDEIDPLYMPINLNTDLSEYLRKVN